jgi:hypothetical protein
MNFALTWLRRLSGVVESNGSKVSPAPKTYTHLPVLKEDATSEALHKKFDFFDNFLCFTFEAPSHDRSRF